MTAWFCVGVRNFRRRLNQTGVGGKNIVRSFFPKKTQGCCAKTWTNCLPLPFVPFRPTATAAAALERTSPPAPVLHHEGQRRQAAAGGHQGHQPAGARHPPQRVRAVLPPAEADGVRLAVLRPGADLRDPLHDEAARVPVPRGGHAVADVHGQHNAHRTCQRAEAYELGRIVFHRH